MKLLEFQAKRLLAQYGIDVPNSMLITSSENFEKVRVPTVLKAQVPVGGRGKAKAIRRVEQEGEVVSVVDAMLALTVKDHAVQAILAEDLVEVMRELYVAYLIDKQANLPLIMVSSAGGVDIEEIAKRSPEQILRKYIDPLVGVQDYSLRALGKALKLGDFLGFSNLLRKLEAVVQDLDATLVEINPLAVTPNGLVALDAKVLLDDKAAYRHQALYDELKVEQERLDRRSKTKAEELAEKWRINYVPLGGDVGLIADGAGTGMLTLDMIHDTGGKAADFCEMGGLSNAEVMQHTMETVLADDRVKVLMISLIGGLTRMDEMAEGIVKYLKENDGTVPIVVRMCGTKSEVGIPMLRDAGVETYEDIAEAVQASVEVVKGS